MLHHTVRGEGAAHELRRCAGEDTRCQSAEHC